MFRNQYIKNNDTVEVLDLNDITETHRNFLLEQFSTSKDLHNVSFPLVILPGTYSTYGRSRNGLLGSLQIKIVDSIKYYGEFNPVQATHDQRDVLNAFAQLADRKSVLKTGLHCVTMENGERRFYDLRAKIEARAKNNEVKYYDVTDSSSEFLLGSGSFGETYIVPGTIKPRFFNKRDMAFSPGENKRAIKIQNHRYKADSGEFSRIKNTIQEVEITKRVDTLGVRELHEVTVDNENKQSSFSLRKLNGDNLIDILEHDHALMELELCSQKLAKCSAELNQCHDYQKEKALISYYKLLEELDYYSRRVLSTRKKLKPEHRAPLSFEERIDISIALLRELKNNIHAKNIRHTDIKPENILFHRAHVGWNRKPRFIDFGLSDIGLEKKQYAHAIGSPIYIPPEGISARTYGSFTDVYAVTRVIGRLFRDQNIVKFDTQAYTMQSFMHERSFEMTVPFRICDGLDIPLSIYSDIYRALTEGSRAPYVDRESVDELIDRFEKIRLSNFQRNIPLEQQNAVIHAHDEALRLLQKISEIKNSHDKGYAHILYEVKNTLNHVEDCEPAIAIFIQTLGLQTLLGCHTKKDVECRLAHIVQEFNNISTKYFACSNEYKNSELYNADKRFRQYVDHCSKLVLDYQLVTLDIDEMYSATLHLRTKMLKMQAAETYYKSQSDHEKDQLKQFRISIK